MIQVSFRKIAPDKVETLKSWMAEAQGRHDEVRETFRQETVRHEQAYLIENSGDHILVYVMELDDAEAARRAFKESALKIDHEHRAVMAEVVEENLDAELLYDVRLYRCPACGFGALDEAPWADDTTASLEICPSCGLQFGYDDAAGGDIDKRRDLWSRWRQQWERENRPNRLASPPRP